MPKAPQIMLLHLSKPGSLLQGFQENALMYEECKHWDFFGFEYRRSGINWSFLGHFHWAWNFYAVCFLKKWPTLSITACFDFRWVWLNDIWRIPKCSILLNLVKLWFNKCIHWIKVGGDPQKIFDLALWNPHNWFS